MRLGEKFEELRGRDEKALIGFITAGYPDVETTIEIADALKRGGVDILELGLPFSDPIADGVTIQRASERSLRAGMNPDIYFDVARRIKGVEKVCLTYYNLILQRGLERFVHDCAGAGISGIIVPDLPVEESEPLLNVCHSHGDGDGNGEGTDLIFLIAPTTTEERMKKILNLATGFIYVVSLLGVTGARDKLSEAIKPLITRIREQESAMRINVPLAVGFGISKPEHVKTVCQFADGAIVGSAIIRIIEEGEEEGIGGAELIHRIEDFTRSLKAATLHTEGNLMHA